MRGRLCGRAPRTSVSSSESSRPACRTALHTAAFTQSCLRKQEVGASPRSIVVCTNAGQTIKTYILGQRWGQGTDISTFLRKLNRFSNFFFFFRTVFRVLKERQINQLHSQFPDILQETLWYISKSLTQGMSEPKTKSLRSVIRVSPQCRGRAGPHWFCGHAITSRWASLFWSFFFI